MIRFLVAGDQFGNGVIRTYSVCINGIRFLRTDKLGVPLIFTAPEQAQVLIKYKDQFASGDVIESNLVCWTAAPAIPISNNSGPRIISASRERVA